MSQCTIVKNLRIEQGRTEDYRKLSRYHYRDSRLGPFAAMFTIRSGSDVVGVIVYRMPSPGSQARNMATDNYFTKLTRSDRLSLINKHIRCISRVIIEPRYRGLGLAKWLVRETMGRLGTAVVEAMAVMGHINPFFEKAGMKAYYTKPSLGCVQMLEAFSLVGIEEADLLEPAEVRRKIELLASEEGEFIEQQIQFFLKQYGKRRDMAAGDERISFVLSKLTFRPVYYIWFNSKMGYGE